MNSDIIRAYRWFRQHSGQSAATCLDLARAEVFAREEEWEFVWKDDSDSWSDLHSDVKMGYVKEEDAQRVQTIEYCIVKDADGNVLSSLCGIYDAYDTYRRIVQAELASDAIYHMVIRCAQSLPLI